MIDWAKDLRGGPAPPGATPRNKMAKPPCPPSVGTDKRKAQPAPTPVGDPAHVTSMQKPRRADGLLVSPMAPLLERENSESSSPARAPSVCSGVEVREDHLSEADFDSDSVQVFVRVRPATSQELADAKHEECITVNGIREVQIMNKEKSSEKLSFTVDHVLNTKTTQFEVFELAGLLAVDNCLAGYNSSIFAYGQTGAGKTYTVMGHINDAERRGLAPRVFENLYQRITDEENAKGRDSVKYNCRCSFLEIYQETIADLLCPSANNLPIREDSEKGPYVEGLSEPNVLNADEMLNHLIKGADNRHVGETRLNRESSRSHSVFTCIVEKTVTNNGVSKIYFARINLIDLAGSERIASGAHGGSNATGEHFREACHINKSLTALGRVTTALLESQKSGGRGHVPYRDSKLTFLLQSSLGGNAKTLIIANVSPSSICAQETMSTLRFMQSAKKIKNDAKVNWTMQGNREAMQREIERLRAEIQSIKTGVNEPLVQMTEDLRVQLIGEQQAKEELQQKYDKMSTNFHQVQRERTMLEKKLTHSNVEHEQMSKLNTMLTQAIDEVKTAEVERVEAATKCFATELQMVSHSLATEVECRRQLEEQLQAALDVQSASATQCAELRKTVQQLQLEKQQADEDTAALAATFAATKEQLEVTQQAAAEEASTAQGRAVELHQQLQAALAAADELHQKLQERDDQLGKGRVTQQQLEEQLAAAKAQLDDREQAFNQQHARLEATERQLSGAVSEVEQLRGRLSQEQQELAQLQRANNEMRDEFAEQKLQLSAQLRAAEGQADEQRQAIEQLQEQLAGITSELGTEQARRAEAEAGRIEVQTQLQSFEQQLAAEAAARAVVNRQAGEAAGEAAELQVKLAAISQHKEEQAAELLLLRKQLQELQAQLDNEVSAHTAVSAALEAARQESSQLADSVRSLEADVQARTLDHSEACSRLQTAEAGLAGLRTKLTDLEGLQQASQQDVASLRSTLQERDEQVCQLGQHLSELQAAKAALDVLHMEQGAALSALKQEHRTQVSQLESRVADLESEKSSLLQHVDTQHDTLEEQKKVVSELQDRLQKEEALRADSVQDAADKVAGLTRKLSAMEREHSLETQKLQDELEKTKQELQQRESELIRKEYLAKSEIASLAERMEQHKKELSTIKASSQAAQDKIKAAYKEEVATLEERLQTTKERYTDACKRNETLKQQLDASQREAEYWRTKQERLDSAMEQVNRLISFARNPPDSARSSLIITRSDHLDSARRGGHSNLALSRPQSLSLRNGSPAASPKGSTRYPGGSNGLSPAASKVGSTYTGRNGADEAGAVEDGWEATSRGIQGHDVRSPGDQLPIPSLEDE